MTDRGGPDRGGGGKQQQRCWECVRRSVTCDFQEPACKRCVDAGIDCPGYGKSRPVMLKWLEPGRVHSRNRKSRSKEKQLQQQSQEKRSKGNVSPFQVQNEEEDLSSRSPSPVVVAYFDLIDLTGEDLKASKAAVDFLHEVVWPKLSPMAELGIYNSIFRVSPHLFQAANATPYYIRHGMTCMALTHQRNRVRGDEAQEQALVTTFLHFRGKMIRSLSEDIATEEKRTGPFVFAGILQLLFADISQGFSDGWRYHFEAAYKFMQSRGGLRAMAEDPSTKILVLTFIYTAVVGDSSSPPADQVLTPQDTRHLDYLIGFLDNAGYTFNTYPGEIFAQIMRINHLRAMATRYGTPPHDLNQQACDILSQLQAFPIEEWVDKTKDRAKEDYKLLGNTYKSAVVVYCISSLQSVSVLQPADGLKEMASAEVQNLYNLMRQALRNPRLKMLLVWPLMVLGVEAVHGKMHEKRDFVRKWTENMCTFTGSYSLFYMREVLEKFWASGKTRWDDCFDRPYIFSSVTNMNLASMA